jgi:hypothetical protein
MLKFIFGFKILEAATVAPITTVAPMMPATAPPAAPNVATVPTLIRKGTICGIDSSLQLLGYLANG